MRRGAEWHRRRRVGAECLEDGVHFRLWAPDHERVELVLEDDRVLTMDRAGRYHEAFVDSARAGMRYSFRPSGAERPYPDPASRFQPEGPHGPSEVIDPGAFRWQHPWPAFDVRRQVLYEMHIGTFTREGTWLAAIPELRALADLGVTTLEVMPANEFAGRFGWGYDGVDLWAPSRLYGRPDDLRRFVDEAHGSGLAVILDVVYNHLGPDGCYMKQFAGAYFTSRYENEWGEAIDFDGPDAEGVREFFVENAAYWIDEFRLDGLRIDATQSMIDGSDRHVLADISTAARKAAAGRTIFLVGENEPQEARVFAAADDGGFGLDAAWNDDFHHAAAVALTGRREAYYTDYRGTPQEFVAAAKHGFLYQGQRYVWQKKRRGSIVRGIAPWRFVWFLENHDQVANSASGRRLHQLASPARFRALTALLLLGPATPMLFQGQEWGSTAPFRYFADHEPELARKVFEGRREFMEQFPSCATPEVRAQLSDPASPATFEACRLDRSTARGEFLALHRDLIRLRNELALSGREFEGAVLSDRAFVWRWLDENAGDLLLVVNIGPDVRLVPAPEPLLAPPAGRRWRVRWASEWPQYGGSGTPEPETEEGWSLAAESAVLLELQDER